MSWDQSYYSNIVKHSLLLPVLYAKSQYIRKTMPQWGPATADLRGCVPHATSTTTKNVLYLGESTMAGVGVSSLKDGLPGLVSEQLSQHYQSTIRWSTHAWVGHTARQLLHRLSAETLPTDTTLVLIALGGNDTFQLTRPSSWVSHIDALVALLRRHDPELKICFASFPPTGTFPNFGIFMRRFVGRQTAALEGATQDYCYRVAGVTMVEDRVVFDDYLNRAGQGYVMEDLFCDGYHPSALTYKLWSQDIARHIITTLSDL